MNILVLCTGNSARSILLEAILNHRAAGRVRAFSAGSRPVGRVHPQALALLASKGMETTGLRSKSWDEFARPEAGAMDVVITVCGSAAGESCPVWPGAPIRGHWGLQDPAAAPEGEQEAAFAAAFARLDTLARRFLALPLESLDRAALARVVAEIGREG